MTQKCFICLGLTTQIANETRRSDNCPSHYCEACDVAMLDESVARRNEEEFYNTVYPSEIKPGTLGNMPSALNLRRIELCQPYIRDDDRILEVGPGAGEFLSLITPHVGESVGCELNRAECAHINDTLGIECHNKDIRDLENIAPFDVIFIFQVFEHIMNPHAFLDSASKLLKDEGYLVIDVPHIRDPLYALYKLPHFRNKFFFVEQHPLTYSTHGLKKVMDMNGFEKVDLQLFQNYSITNHLNWIYLNKGSPSFKEGMEATLENVEDPEYREIWDKIDAYYKELLVERSFSDYMFAVFRKH